MKKSKLESFCSIMNGHSFRGKIIEESEGNVKVVQLSDIDELNGVNFEKLIQTNLEISKTKNEILLKDGDILCVSKGPRLYSICLKNVPDNIVANFHVTIIRPLKADILPEFLSWTLNNSQKYFTQMSQGSAVSHLSKSQLAELEVEIPVLKVQKQIIELENLKNTEKKLLLKLSEARNVFTSACQKQILTNFKEL